MNKKIFRVILLGVMIISVCACSKKNDKPKETVNLDEFTIPAVETVEETTEKETEKKTEVETDAQEQNNNAGPEGIVKGDKYINEYFDITFTCPEGFEMTEEEMGSGSFSNGTQVSFVLFAADVSIGSSVIAAVKTTEETMDLQSMYETGALDRDIVSNGGWIIDKDKIGKFLGREAYICDASMQVDGSIGVKSRIVVLVKEKSMILLTMSVPEQYEHKMEELINAFE